MNKGELQEYIWIKKNIDQLEEKLLEVETQATKMTSTLSDEPRGGGNNFDKIPRLVSEIVRIQKEINDELQRLYALQKKIEDSIKPLTEREKYLIRAKYMQGKTFEQIAVDMCYCWRQVHRVHGVALKKLKMS